LQHVGSPDESFGVISAQSVDQDGTRIRLDRYAKFAWAVLGYTVLVILWGALVRATHAGAGCGNHWPLCNGEVIPLAPKFETIIEFTHRVTTGLALPLVCALFWWASKQYTRGHAVRRAAFWSLVLILIEALLGAGLVRFELVVKNSSAARVAYLSLHLINTFILLGALTLTAWYASTRATARRITAPVRSDSLATDVGLGFAFKNRDLKFWLFAIAIMGTLLLGVTGAIAALGDTLFPVKTLAEGVRQDFDQLAHPLVRLRLLHPLVAVAVGTYLIALGGLSLCGLLGDASRHAKIFAGSIITLVFVQIFAGTVNVVLLAPVWMQLVHLFLADLLWIALVLFIAASLAKRKSIQTENLGYIADG